MFRHFALPLTADDTPPAAGGSHIGRLTINENVWGAAGYRLNKRRVVVIHVFRALPMRSWFPPRISIKYNKLSRNN
jgi:hypothetical protein